MQQSLRIFAHRAEVRRLAVIEAVGLEILRMTAQRVGGLLKNQPEPLRCLRLIRLIIDQHQPRAGARLGGPAKSQRTEVDHRHHRPAIGEHPGHPVRRPGNRLQRQARQHFGHFGGAQGIALAADAKQQKQRLLRHWRGATLGDDFAHQTLNRETPLRRPTATWLSSSMAKLA